MTHQIRLPFFVFGVFVFGQRGAIAEEITQRRGKSGLDWAKGEQKWMRLPKEEQEVGWIGQRGTKVERITQNNREIGIFWVMWTMDYCICPF